MMHPYAVTKKGKLHKRKTIKVMVGKTVVGTVTVIEPCDKEYQYKALDGQKIKITL
jgi:hypothetical protein